MLKFALIGVGFIAPRHLEAMKAVGGDLIAAYDVSDSVGILDKYFFNTKFFTKELHFSNYLFNNRPDYLTICSPTQYHLAHLYLADSLGVKAICEKPLVLNIYDYDRVYDDVYTILQLRYADNLERIQPINGEINIEYSTPRGDWYHKSWKGSSITSGGLLMNIGIHLFDLMIYLFGKPSEPILNYKNYTEAKGNFLAGSTLIKWHLSIDPLHKSLRKINDVVLNMDNLHTRAYEEIIKGNGIKKKDIKQSLELINEYRILSENI